MKKRFAAVAAASLMALQLAAVGTASAASTHLGTQAISLGSDAATDACVFAGGIAVVTSNGEAVLWTDNQYLYCDVSGAGADARGGIPGKPDRTGGPGSSTTWNNSSPTAGVDNAPLLAEVKSIQVTAANGVAVIGYAADDGGDPVTYASGVVKAAAFGGKPMSVDTPTYFEWDAVAYDGYFGANVKVTNTTFSGSGLVGKFLYATEIAFDGGSGADTFDASAVTVPVPVTASGGYGGDTIKGGASDDSLTGEDGTDVLYGNGGSDELDCSGDTGFSSDSDTTDYTPFHDQCWGGAGDDSISLGGVYTAAGDDLELGTGDDEVLNSYDIVAPGDGYDFITGTDGADVATTFTAKVTYVDSSSAIDTSLLSSGEIDTTADFDIFMDVDVTSVTGSEKGDAIWMFDPITGAAEFHTALGGGGADTIKGSNGDDVIYGGAGADTIKSRGGDDLVNGQAGDDVIYGGGGADTLKGLAGSDQTWGGKGTDRCSGEVKDSCEYVLA